jgi:hypothetical protein
MRLPTQRSLLTALDYVLLLVVGIGGLAALLTLIDAATSDTLADLTVSLPTDDVDAALPSGVELTSAEGVVDADTGLGERLAWWLAGPATVLFAVAGATILREVVGTAQDGDPFVPANVRRLRILAAVTTAYFAVTAARPLVGEAIEGGLDVDVTTAPVSAVPLTFALALLALAEVWQRGVSLRDEQRLTV